MQVIIHSLKGTMSFNNFPLLTILANIFWGLALGKILMTQADGLAGSILIKAFLIVVACLFANYLMCLRKAFRGINRNMNGKLRPFLREAIQCAVLNVLIFLFSMTLFFIKSNVG